MTIYNLTVAASKYRDLEAELADAAAHAIHGGIVLARVARVENEVCFRQLCLTAKLRVRVEIDPES